MFVSPIEESVMEPLEAAALRMPATAVARTDKLVDIMTPLPPTANQSILVVEDLEDAAPACNNFCP